MKRSLLLLTTMVLLLALALPSLAAAATDQQYHYGFINTDYVVQTNGDISVTEVVQYVFTSGSFHHVYRNINMTNIEAITDISLKEGNLAYQPVSGETQNGYTAVRSSGTTQVDWWFPYTSNASRTFTLTYTIKGGLRIYDGGDQLWMKSIWPDRGQTVNSTKTVVHLPAGVDAAQTKTAYYGVSATTTQPDPSTVVFTTGSMGDGQQLEVRVQFQHGIVQAAAPSWQQAADAQVARDAQMAPIRNLIALISLLLCLLIPIGGGIALYMHWYNKGRDKPIGLVADYIPNPPSDLPAGVVGTLIDESADLKDIVASVVDLAHRGIIAISEQETPRFVATSDS